MFSILFIMGFSALTYGQETKRVLFLGNSYTAFNNLPSLIDSIANSFGDTLVHDMNLQLNLQYHAGDNSSMSKIRQGNWDFVVVQGQSVRPAQSTAPTNVYPYAEEITDSIRENNLCGKAMFFMTWGRENGYLSSGSNSTYNGMQENLYNAYLTMTTDNDGVCAPVGAVWKYVRDSFPTINLYDSDGSHPSVAGSYLAACTFYAAIFRKTPETTPFYGGLTRIIAEDLQKAAAHIVLDSLDTWHLLDYDVQAAFTSITNNNTVNFSNFSTNSVAYQWNFDDGSALNTSLAPSHTFQSGTYEVELVAFDNCGLSDTLVQTIVISTITNTEKLEISKESLVKCYPNPVKSILYIDAAEEIKSLKIFDVTGQIVLAKKELATNKLMLNPKIQKGLFLLELELSSGQKVIKKVVFNSSLE